jgi:hypothetical protein
MSSISDNMRVAVDEFILDEIIECDGEAFFEDGEKTFAMLPRMLIHARNGRIFLEMTATGFLASCGPNF